MEIGLLKQLYEYHSCPVMAYGAYGRELLEQMAAKGWLEEDNHLLSIEERNYFDYYLYNTPFTNGPALRNRYVHGTSGSPNQDYKHKSAYNRLLILLILELLKIEDDLIQKQSSVTEEVNELDDNHILMCKIAEVMSFSNPKALTNGGKYLLFPKKVGFEDGYVYVNTLGSGYVPAYVALVKGTVIPEYMAFVMNSSPYRQALISSNGTKTAQLTVERIKMLKVPNSEIECQIACGKLERLIAQRELLKNGLSRIEKLQQSLFVNLRNYLSFELLRPEFKEETGIDFVEPFIEMMKGVAGDEEQSAQQIADTLLKPGNVLMDNMKKARIVMNKNNQG